MQGNEWDEQLVDKAWADMRRLLDQEMPVQEQTSNKSRFLWLFLLFGMASLGALLGYRFYNSPSVLAAPGAFPVPMEGGQPVAIQENKVLHADNTLHTETVINTNTVNNTKNSIIKRTPAEQIKSTKQQEFAGVIEENTASIILLADTAVVETVFPTDIAMENSVEQEQFNYESVTIAAQIPGLELNALDYEDRTDQLDALPQIPIKRKKRKRTGLEVGGIINHIRPIDGYSVGLVRELPFKNSKLGMRVGLAYRQHSRQHSYYRSQGYSLDFANLSGREIGASPNTPAGFELDAYVAENSYVARLPYAENIKMHYAGLPIALTYKLSKHWKVESGITLSYLLNAFRTDEYGEQEALAGLFNFSAGNAVQLERSADNSNSPGDYNRFDIAASAGIGFYPHHKFGLRLRYDYGFLPFDKASNFVDRNRNIHFSAVYFLK